MDISWVLLGILNIVMLALLWPLFKGMWAPIEFNGGNLVTEIQKQIPSGMWLCPTQTTGDDIISFCFLLPKKRWRRWKTYDKFIQETAQDALKHFTDALLYRGIYVNHPYVWIGPIHIMQSTYKREEGSPVTVQIVFSIRDHNKVAEVEETPKLESAGIEEGVIIPNSKVRSIFIFKKGV